MEHCAYEGARVYYSYSGRGRAGWAVPEICDFIHSSLPPFLDLREEGVPDHISTWDPLPSQPSQRPAVPRPHHYVHTVLRSHRLLRVTHALPLPRQRDRSLAPAPLAIPHRTVVPQSWAQSPVHPRQSCVLRATRTGSLRGSVGGTLPVRSPGSLWRYRVGSAPAAWGGDEGSGLVFRNCHCTLSHLINSVPDTVPQRDGEAGRSWLCAPFS